MQYWDTSALLKLYIPEPDSQVLAAHLSQSPICISQIGQTEMLRAIARKEVEGVIPPTSAVTIFGKFLADVSLGRIVVIPFDAVSRCIFASWSFNSIDSNHRLWCARWTASIWRRRICSRRTKW